MSHFSVLIITEIKPTEDDLAAALAPFHEFECTGRDDEYVQNIDITEEARQTYDGCKEARLRAPDGTLHEPYDDEFYRDPTAEELHKIGPIAGTGCGNGMSWCSKDWGDGRGYRPKIHFVPAGWEKVYLSASDLESFASWASDYYGSKVIGPSDAADPKIDSDLKYGWIRVDDGGNVVEIIDRTNPNKKWDWWQLGGRWSGFLRAKPGFMFRQPMPSKGSPGVLGTQSDATGFDIIRKGDVDFHFMRNRAKVEARNRWDRVHEVVGDLSDFVPWDRVREEHGDDIDAARKAYHAQRAKRAIWDAGRVDDELAWVDLEDFMVTRDEYTRRAALSAAVTFAVLKDGQWAERGEMGWWGCVSGEKADWNEEFNAMLETIPDDHWLSIVDCHI